MHSDMSAPDTSTPSATSPPPEPSTLPVPPSAPVHAPAQASVQPPAPHLVQPTDAQAQRNAWLWLVLAGLTGLSLLASGLLWGKLSGMQQHLAAGSAQSQTTAQEAKALAQTMAERAESNQAKLALLDARLQEMDVLNRQVEGLLQQATRTQNSNLLTDLEASLRLAQQQAQFTRNAQPLLDALGQAQTRLAQAGDAAVLLKPASAAVGEDLTRLKTANYPDISAAVDQLDDLVLALDTLPLWIESAAPEHTAPLAADKSADKKRSDKSHPAIAQSPTLTPTSTPAHSPTAWLASLQQLGAYLWQETRSLVQVERMDNANPAALTAQESALLREQLKLYVLGARTAILSGRLPQAQQTLAQLQIRLPRYFQSGSADYHRVHEQLAAVRAQLGSGSNAAPQAQASINAIVLLNERLLAVPLGAGLPAAARTPHGSASLEAGQKGQPQR